MDVNPINYELTFEPDLKKFVFLGTEIITVSCNKSTNLIRMDCAEIKVKSCTVKSGSKIIKSTPKTDEKKEQLSIRLGEKIKGKATIHLEFQGILNDRLLGFYRSQYKQGGKTKYLAEHDVSKNSENLIVRASVLYGWLPPKFSSIPTSSMKQYNFGLWLINSLMKNESLYIITDEISTPLIADDFANSILHLVSKNFSGIFHSASKIPISRYDFSIKMAKFLGLNHELIKPTTNKELGRDVKTSLNKCLDSSKLESTGFRFLTLDESFELIKNQMGS